MVAIPLLKDRVLNVRFRAAQALALGREKSAVPVLIDLIGEAPQELRWQVEEMLVRLAGDQAPSGSSGDAESLKVWREAWAAWWAKNGTGIDMARMHQTTPFLNLTLVPEMHANKVWEFDRDGKVRWTLDKDLQCPIDAQVLPGGRILVAELNGHRVTERDREGKIVWEKKINTPIACERLSNGNTFIATNNAAHIVRPDGKEIFTYNAEEGFFIHSIQRRKNGNLVCVSMGGTVREIDPTGKKIRDIPLNDPASWSGIEGLPGDRYLVVGGGKVREIDAAGKVLWKLDHASACYATRLPNGNTLVVDNAKGLVEVDKMGKVVWEKGMTTSLWRAHRR